MQTYLTQQILTLLAGIFADLYSRLPQSERPRVTISEDESSQIVIKINDSDIVYVINDTLDEILHITASADRYRAQVILFSDNHLHILHSINEGRFLEILTEKQKQQCLSNIRNYLNQFNLTAKYQALLDKARAVEVSHLLLVDFSMQFGAITNNVQQVELALSSLPIVLTLKIPRDTDTGIFAALLIYPEKNYVSELSQHLKPEVMLGVNFFAKASLLQIIYDDKIISLPENVRANLLKYLTETYKIVGVISEFTCHQFCGLIKTGELHKMEEGNITYGGGLHHHLLPGEVVHFTQQNPDKVIHSALYLGEGLYLSKNGRCFPAIFTLDELLSVYPVDCLFVATNYNFENSVLNTKLSLFENFKDKVFVRNSLCFKMLGIYNERFRQFDATAIRNFYRRASAKFHPDKTTLPNEKAKKFFELIQIAYKILADPIQRSDYYTSLLAGRDWSVAKILGISRHTNTPQEIIERYHDFIDLLKEHNQCDDEIERTIKSEAEYLTAAETINLPALNTKSDDVVLQVGNRTHHMGNGDPYFPTIMRFSEQSQKLECQPYFPMSAETRIGDLLVTFGEPVSIALYRNSLTEEAVQSELARLPEGLILYPEVIKAVALLDLFSERSNERPLGLKPKQGQSEFIANKPGGFVFFSNASRTAAITPAVYLGGNFYLFSSNAGLFYIANIAFIINQKVVGAICSLLGNDNMSAREDLEHALDRNTGEFVVTESFPLFEHRMSENFKRYLLKFNEYQLYSLMLYLISGKKVLNDGLLPSYTYIPSKLQHSINTGDHILLCNGTAVITSALHLGNYIFLIQTSAGLHVANLLMLAESADWNRLFIIKKPVINGNQLSAEIALQREFAQFSKIKAPLLYLILSVKFDLNRLSDIDENTILNCYRERMKQVSDAYQKEVVTLAYRLLMNDYFRVFYATEVLFGKENEFSISQLLNLTHDISNIDKLQTYIALISLIDNIAHKEYVMQKLMRNLPGFTCRADVIALLSHAVKDENTSQQKFNAIVSLLKCFHSETRTFMSVIVKITRISEEDYQIAFSYCLNNKMWPGLSDLLRNKTQHLTIEDFNKLAALVSSLDDILYVIGDWRTSQNTKKTLFENTQNSVFEAIFRRDFDEIRRKITSILSDCIIHRSFVYKGEDCELSFNVYRKTMHQEVISLFILKLPPNSENKNSDYPIEVTVNALSSKQIEDIIQIFSEMLPAGYNEAFRRRIVRSISYTPQDMSQPQAANIFTPPPRQDARYFTIFPMQQTKTDARFAPSSEPGILYKTSSITPISDETLLQYGFPLDQCVRSQEGNYHYAVIYDSSEAAKRNTISYPPH